MSEHVPIVWKRGERCYIEDIDGNVFLDFTSGVLVANAGHSHPQLVAAMKDQVGKVVNSYDFVNEFRPELAQRLVEITPPNMDKALVDLLQKSFFNPLKGICHSEPAKNLLPILDYLGLSLRPSTP